MTLATLIAAAMLLAAGGPVSWLDVKSGTPPNWNVAGAAIPVRPGPRDAELGPGGRCAAALRPQFAPEDRAVTSRGWSLVGGYHRFGPTVVVMATASADGMCRPDGYQGFVFVNGTFAGTIAPHPMDARTDGSIASISVTLFSATEIEADFARYAAADPLCCPHATSTVLYQLPAASAPPRLTPASVTTQSLR